MKHIKLTLVIVCIAATTLTTGAAVAKEKPPEVDNHGLHLVHHSDLRLVYTLPDVDFTKYDKAILVDAYVAFKKNYKRDHNDGMNRVTNRDMEKMKKRVAAVAK